LTRLLGIDIGTRAIKIAEIEAQPKLRSLVGLYELARYENETPGQALKKFFEQSGIQADRLCLGLGGTPVFTHKFSFPFSDRKRLIPAVAAEFEDLLPFELDGQVMDVQWLKKNGRTHHFRAGLVLETSLQERNAALEFAGLSADGVFCDAEALGQFALRQGLPASEAASPYLVIEWGFSSTKLALLQGTAAQEWNKKAPKSIVEPELLEFKTLSHGAWTLMRHLMDKKQLSFEDAEQWLLHRADIKRTNEGQLSDDISDEIKNGLRPFVVELFQLLQSFKSQSDLRPTTAYVTGPLTRISGFLQFLTDELQIEVVAWPIGLGLDLSRKNLSASESLSFASAIALAARYAMPKATGWLNFRRSSAASKKLLTQWLAPFSQPEAARPLGFAALAWLLVVVYAVSAGHFVGQEKTRAQKELATELRRLDRSLGNSAERISKDFARAESAVQSASDKKEKEWRAQQGSTQATAHSDVLLHLSRSLPASALLKRVQVEEEGTGASLTALVQPTVVEDAKVTELQNQIQSQLAREGFSSVQLSRKGGAIEVQAKRNKMEAL
jgi:Tfp pilus assembly PilM family ATPase